MFKKYDFLLLYAKKKVWKTDLRLKSNNYYFIFINAIWPSFIII